MQVEVSESIADVAALDVHAFAVADVGHVELDVLRGGEGGGEDAEQDGDCPASGLGGRYNHDGQIGWPVFALRFSKCGTPP